MGKSMWAEDTVHAEAQVRNRTSCSETVGNAVLLRSGEGRGGEMRRASASSLVSLNPALG